MSKQQIRYAGGDERCGRRRVGLLNPLSGETHKQGMYLDRWTKQKISNIKKRLAGKGRRRARPERRRNAKTKQNVTRARSRTGAQYSDLKCSFIVPYGMSWGRPCGGAFAEM